MAETSGALALYYYMTLVCALSRGDLQNGDPTAKPPDHILNSLDKLLAVAVYLDLVDQVVAKCSHNPHNVLPN